MGEEGMVKATLESRPRLEERRLRQGSLMDQSSDMGIENADCKRVESGGRARKRMTEGLGIIY
jgi:hypothetical protein